MNEKELQKSVAGIIARMRNYAQALSELTAPIGELDAPAWIMAMENFAQTIRATLPGSGDVADMLKQITEVSVTTVNLSNLTDEEREEFLQGVKRHGGI